MSDLPVTTVILVRHGHVEGIDPPRFRGRTNLDLTPLGRRQIAALRDRIVAEWKPAAIYTSPMGRCVATGETIAEAFGLTAQPVAGFNDVDYGAWQGLTHAEVQARWPREWARWRSAPQSAAIPDGESLPELAKRVTHAIQKLIATHDGDAIVVVAHDSVNRTLLLHALGLPLSHYHRITQAPCTLNVLEFEGGRFAVRTLNETGHLLGS